MSDFEFLRRMYRRLSEFEQWAAKAANEGERKAQEGAAIAIKASIQDYLNLRREQINE
jgi:hypothetical protein